jgi:ubiquinone/menaquinone biosynthesis C-methylase UbiE
MIKVRSFSDVLECYFALSGKTLIDVGCGTGDLVRWATKQGAGVVGVDTAAMIAQAERRERAGDEEYRIGSAEALSFESGSRDLLTYFASLHHVPPQCMRDALKRCRDILKPGGAAVFLEPLSRKGSYYDIVRLVDDEIEARTLARRAIGWAPSLGLEPETREHFYVERSYADYLGLLEMNVADAGRRSELAAAARKATERLARKSGESFEEVRFRSICRLDILRKPN